MTFVEFPMLRPGRFNIADCRYCRLLILLIVDTAGEIFTSMSSRSKRIRLCGADILRRFKF